MPYKKWGQYVSHTVSGMNCIKQHNVCSMNSIANKTKWKIILLVNVWLVRITWRSLFLCSVCQKMTNFSFTIKFLMRFSASCIKCVLDIFETVVVRSMAPHGLTQGWWPLFNWNLRLHSSGLTFRGPCIVIYSYYKSQRDAQILKFIW